MVTILCSGSRGDIQPYLALAVALKDMSQDVRIAVGKSFGDLVAQYGVKHVPLETDYQSADIDPKLLEAAGSATNPLKMLFAFNKMKKYARQMVDGMYEACQGSDVIVYHPGCTIGYYAAEQMGIPSVLASPFPMHRTSETLSVIAYGKTRMPVSFSYRLLQSFLWMASKTGIMLFWKERFGSLPPHFGCPFERVDERHPAIVSCSNHVFPRPMDWNEHAHQSGYWFTREGDEYAPPEDLLAFLEKGDKPIYFGFGSLSNNMEKETFLHIALKALEETGRRGILCGMGSLPDLPENLFALQSIPHTWLFPRCAAVCHHGGAGTTAAGFAAGVPSVIVPFSNDQFAWAHRSHDLGIGAKPIYKKQLTASRLADAISEALSETVTHKARQMGERIAGENGARDCAAVITSLIGA